MEIDGEMDWLVKVFEEPRAWRYPGGAGNRANLKSDEEPAKKSLNTGMGRFHGGAVTLGVSARRESQSNGAFDQSEQVVAVFVRVLKEQHEQNATVNLGPTDTISFFGWSDGQPCYCSKYMVGRDGQTAHEVSTRSKVSSFRSCIRRTVLVPANS